MTSTRRAFPFLLSIVAFLACAGSLAVADPPPSCGDGVRNHGEQCDDGNGTDWDGCDADCRTTFWLYGDRAPGSSGITLTWTGAFPRFVVHRSTDASLVGGPGTQLGDTAATTWPDGAVPARGTAFYYLVSSLCGNATTDAGEECDDGNNYDQDGCRAGCFVERCGDGTVDAGEECDDGNDVSGDGCQSDCRNPYCGDGILDSGETCDDGSASDLDACGNDCLPNFCGDGQINLAETCDDGAANSDTTPDACRTDCSLPECGDAVVDSGEACDAGAANSDTEPNACRTNCVQAACGDGVVDRGEICDAGAANSDTQPDACRTDCDPAGCGDGVLDAGETCDAGAANSDTQPDACRTDCDPASCGDGVVDAGETCDAGAANSDTQPDACRTDCDPAGCGDGVLDAGETCDAGAANSDTQPDACRTDCDPAGCGDGVVDAGETCDAGAANSDTQPNACRTDCDPAGCGDGVVDAGEACDGGAANSDTQPNACRTDCVPAACGDGVVDTGETCDAGAANSDTQPNACRTDCEPARCGDGVLDADEGCDDGNVANGDGCPSDCSEAPCGNGRPDPGEQCDDGSANSDTEPDACRSDCTAAGCGDAVVDAGEVCDEGGANSDVGASLCHTDCTLAWHGGDRRYRIQLQAAAAGYARTDRVVEASLNLQTALAVAGASEKVRLDSLLLLEVDVAGDPIDTSVPFQFDGSTAGTLVWLLEGATAANATRRYHLYLDTMPHAAPVFDDRVVVATSVPDAGQDSFRIATERGTFFFQKEGAGFSSLLDARGHDWIAFSDQDGSAGEFRGVPNLVYPANLFHPGFTSASSTLVFDGPLKATIESPSDNGQFRTRWELYPGYAKLTVLQATGSYWFLYEGTPGGVLDRSGPNADFLVRSDGTQYPVTGNWGSQGQDIPGDEWVYFADPTSGQSLFLAHHTNDTVVDWYEPLDFPAGGPSLEWMTVFGFGRGSSASSHLTGAGRKFTLGLLPTTQYGASRAAIEGAYKDVTVQVAAAERLVPGCGNGQLDAGEACDDGNVQAGDGCDAACGIEFECGDGTQDPGEQCDDGDAQNGDGCDSQCVLEICGNGVVQAGEQCDDGNADDLDACDNDCHASVCGDGIVQGSEGCDLGAANSDAPNAACRTNCTPRRCGDGIVDGGEACDDGNVSSTDACLATCQVATCGDGFVHAGVEPCDDGNASNADSCRVGCIAARCGDGILRTGVEACDDGNAVDGDTCTNFCRANLIRNGTYAGGSSQWTFFSDASATFSVVGGEGRVAITTQGNNVQLYQSALALSGSTGYTVRFRGRSTGGQDVRVVLQQHGAPFAGYGLNQVLNLGTAMQTLSAPFTTTAGNKTDGRFVFWLADHDQNGIQYFFDDVVIELAGRCGDSIVDPGEQCDDGNTLSGDGCQASCRTPTCGDGFLDAGEQCDDGNAQSGDGCQPTCQHPACGDGIVDPGEACDDGNAVDGDLCPSDCAADCGDGVLDPGEECDLGAANGDGPTADCRGDCRVAGCGDGIVGPGEACDDGNIVAHDGCSPDCALEVPACGNGFKESGEACDDGNAASGDGCEPDCALVPPSEFRHPRAGEIYKEFSRVISVFGNDWRVTDPEATATGEPGNEPGSFLPNPQLALTVDDLAGALRAELLLDVWGGHVGTTLKGFRVNGHPYIAIPEPNTTPTAGQCYTHQWNVVVPVPLGDLVQGSNVFEGTTGAQSCYSFDWGQFGWYSLTLRVYYGPAKPHPTGAIVSPVDGATIGDAPLIHAVAQSPAGIRKVEFLAYHEGVDFDGDGRYVDWQGAYQRPVSATSAPITRHVGTDDTSPYQVTWDTSLVPEQLPGRIRLLARIQDQTGMWYVTDEVTGLNIARPGYAVRLYKPTGMPENFWVRAGQTASATLTIPAAHDLNAATQARLVVRSWNGIDGGIEPGQTHFTRVNAWNAPNYGANHYYSLDILNVPPAELLSGANSFSVGSESVHHGIEALWPGPQLVVRYTLPPGACGDGGPDAGETCDDGNVNNGDGCNAACRIESCGDGVIQLGLGEQCDDGNAQVGDGCAPNCRFEGCGNGIREAGEACDDGNVSPGDGCSSTCVLETPCGNGTLDPGELCDDGNTNTGDGCSNTCKRIVSDDFHAPALNTAVWTTVNPLGDATFAISGSGSPNARLEIAVPGGASHDAWVTNLAPRVLQGADNSNFDVQIKLESSVSAGNQFQGILVEEDANDWLRFDVYSNGSQHRGLIARSLSGAMTAAQDVSIGSGASPSVMYLRVTRVGNFWTFRRSLDGTSWTNVGTGFTSALVVRRVGVHAGNGAGNPAHTARFDWFFDTAAPIVPEDPGSLCGNGVLDAGEECDLGASNSSAPGAACRLDCTDAGCGDGIVDPGEVCDDGNLANADGCSASCQDEAICGDGTLDPGEVCDDGNTVSGDGCSGVCEKLVSDDFRQVAINPTLWTAVNPLGDATFVVTGAGTANARLEIGVPSGVAHDHFTTSDAPRLMQGVDDRNLELETKLESTAFQSSVQFQGILVEQDLTNWVRISAVSNAGSCSAVLTVRAGASVSNVRSVPLGATPCPNPLYLRLFRTGSSWLGQYSTNGTSFANVGTSYTAALVVHAVGLIAGNAGTNPAFTARFDYLFDLTAPIVPEDPLTCGNGTLDAGEQCDDGAANSNIAPDACRLNCQLAGCPDGVVDTGEECDDGNAASGDGCQAGCVLPECGDGILDPGEACDDGAGNSNVTPGACRTSCLPAHCGDAVVDPGEECDLGASNSDAPGAACRTSCDLAGCGDGIVDPGEGCDEAAANSQAPDSTCRTDCQPAGCGDGVEDTGEACDDGNVSNGDGCSSGCTLETDCGNGALDPGEICDDGNTLSGDGCSNQCEKLLSDDFHQLAIDSNLWTPMNPLGDATFLLTGTSTADARLEIGIPAGTAHDHFTTSDAPRLMQGADDVNLELEAKLESTAFQSSVQFQGILVEQDATNWVRVSAVSNAGSCSAVLTARAGASVSNVRSVAIGATPCPNPLYLRLFRTGSSWLGQYSTNGTSFTNVGASYTAALVVHRVGLIAGNAGTNPAFTARFDYLFDLTAPIVPEDPVTCGDGDVDPGEQCDDGAANSDTTPNACRTNCRLAGCPDGVVDTGEGCDDGNATSGDGCQAGCVLPECGDGILDAGEGCDEGAANSEAPDADCRTDCQPAGCGDGVADTGEACDDGNLANGDGCSSTCSIEQDCGNGTLDPGESCDDGNVVSGDGCSAACKGLVSDDFRTGSLNPTLWTTFDPKGGATFAVTGAGTANARLEIGVPAGTDHDYGTTNDSPRAMQTVDDSNFTVEAKLESAPFNVNTQFQGILIEQSATSWLHLSAVATGSQCMLIVSARNGGTVTYPALVTLAGGCPNPLWLRVTRSGTTWTARYSLNGTSFSPIGANFTRTLAVSAVGVLAGNTGTNPAFNARFDYLFDANAPIVPEDVVTCGNGALDPEEECDDGAANSDSVPDACRTNCTAAGCGDAVVDTGEECDDGAANSEAPDADCRTDCRLAGCGDGVVDTGETCDDGNLANGDGCSAVCQLETSCGNGMLDAGEVCDDGNTLSGDGCSSTCKKIVSDDFRNPALGSVWTTSDPLGGSTFSLTGSGTEDARLEIAVPGGTAHDAWNANQAPRAMQGADDSNFDVYVKLESSLSAANQFQGLIVEQDAANWMRFDVYSNGSGWYGLAAKTIAGSTTAVRNVSLGAGASPSVLYLRLQRTGDTWRFRYSLDGLAWSDVGGTFVHDLDVHAVGVQAGNGVTNPALTARFDFFMDVAAPIDPEDGF